MSTRSVAFGFVATSMGWGPFAIWLLCICSLWNRSSVSPFPSGFWLFVVLLVLWFAVGLVYGLVSVCYWSSEVCYGVGEVRSYGLVHYLLTNRQLE